VRFLMVSGSICTRAALIAAIITSSGIGQVALAASSGGGSGTRAIPYISGRLGPVTAPTEAPVGAVVPDDFCLPGKLDDCGDHLRDAPDFSPGAEALAQAQGGPIFVGGDNPAFVLAPTKVWAQTQFRQTSLSSGAEVVDERSTIIGGDHRFGDSFILGAMVAQSDITTTFSPSGIKDAETGIFAGPYLALRLSDVWALDARYLFGSSDHTLTTGGIFTGEYKSKGGFGAVRVSGTFDRGNWRLHPSMEFATIFQDSDAYIDGLRGPIAAASTSDSFVTAALLAYYNGLGRGAGDIVPYAGFEISQPTDGAGSAFGVLRGGLAVKIFKGGVLNFDYAEGAIGLSGVEDRLIALRLEIPL